MGNDTWLNVQKLWCIFLIILNQRSLHKSVLFIHAMYQFFYWKQNTVINVAVVHWLRLEYMNICFGPDSEPYPPFHSRPHATFLSLKSMYSDFHWFYLVLFVYAKIQEQLLEHLYPLTGLIFEINGLPFPRQPSFANIS